MTIDFINHHEDSELLNVAADLMRRDPSGERWRRIIRHTYDMIYLGAETGRYRWDQLMKTEKTHFGSMFEINAQREFEFKSGVTTDFEIAGVEVDAKWSQTDGGWMLPPEVFDRIALIATGDDRTSLWSLGLVRVSEACRRSSTNRDAKTGLNQLGRQNIRWLWRNEDLTPNVLLQLSPETVDSILQLGSGTARVDALFRAAEGRIVHRAAVLTVARQLDGLRRLRGGQASGARASLRDEGFLILSGDFHSEIASFLGIATPTKGEYVSVRVVPSTDGQGVQIDGSWWRRAEPGDPYIKAPELAVRR